MKIYIHYDITESPWGGGNSFLKAFRYYCREQGIELVNSINGDYDIFFYNSCNKAPGKFIDINELLNIKRFGTDKSWKRRLYNPGKKILVYRSDGFRDEYADVSTHFGDLLQRLSLHLSDHIVFQNKKSLNTAARDSIGYRKNNYSIIYNGINQDIFRMKEDGYWNGQRPLKVFSANWSNNPNKGYATIAAFSELDGVESYFCGNWPKEIDPKNVQISLPLPQKELAREYRKYDIFLHPSRNDQSPNVCLEAVSSGLPILFDKTSGMGEIAGDCGLEINDDNLQETLDEIKRRYSDFIQVIKERRNYFSINRCAAEYIKCFKSLLEKSSS